MRRTRYVPSTWELTTTSPSRSAHRSCSRGFERCGITVDFGQRMVWRDGVEVKLSPTEYLLLVALARRPGRICDHRALLREVWGPEYIDEWTYLRTFARRLRAKLEADRACPEVIVSVPGRG